MGIRWHEDCFSKAGGSDSDTWVSRDPIAGCPGDAYVFGAGETGPDEMGSWIGPIRPVVPGKAGTQEVGDLPSLTTEYPYARMRPPGMQVDTG